MWPSTGAMRCGCMPAPPGPMVSWPTTPSPRAMRSSNLRPSAPQTRTGSPRCKAQTKLGFRDQADLKTQGEFGQAASPTEAIARVDYQRLGP